MTHLVSRRPSLSQRVRIKRLLVQIHLWLGLTLGFVWAVQGLTGALLVFHREVDRAVLAAPAPGSLPLGALIASAARVQDAPAESIGLYFADPGRPGVLAVGFAPKSGEKAAVLVSTASGQVLAERPRAPQAPSGGLARWLYNLHHFFLMGETGGWLVGASGLVLVSGALTGLWLGWPRRGQWRAAFARARWRTALQQLFGWHRASGLAASLALVLLALSGAAMSFGKPLREWAPRHFDYRVPYKAPPEPPLVGAVGPDRALAIALAALPGSRFVSVGLPGEKSGAYQVRLNAPGEWRTWSGTSLVTVSQGGRVLDVYDAAKAPLANRLLESAFAVHSGEVAGLAGRIAVALAGLSLPALYVSGVLAWWRKRRLARRRLPSPDAEAAPGRLLAG